MHTSLLKSNKRLIGSLQATRFVNSPERDLAQDARSEDTEKVSQNQIWQVLLD